MTTEPPESPPPSATTANRALKVFAVLAVIGIAFFLLVRLLSQQSDDGTNPASGGPYTVTIAGATTADVTVDIDGSEQQHTGATQPYTLTVPDGARIISVGAQSSGNDAPSDFSCSITNAAGDVLKEAHSSGQYSTVTCAVDVG